MKNFTEKLKKALKEKGISQKELAQRIEMSESGLIKMMNNNTIQVETLETICGILDVPITYFLDIEIKPVGFWRRLLDEANQEAQNWKLRAYQLEEQLSQQPNFKYVSRRQGVLGNVA